MASGILLWHSLDHTYNSFLLQVHYRSLKRIDCLNQICLAHSLSFECFHCYSIDISDLKHTCLFVNNC